jgi:di/tricarboxylate transporter
MIAFAILPFLFLKIFPIELNSDYLRSEVVKRKEELGSPSRAEKILSLILVIMLSLWVSGGITHIDAALVAFGGMILCVFLKVVTWQELISNRVAWGLHFIIYSNALSLTTF